jgi:hypothetical protein
MHPAQLALWQNAGRALSHTRESERRTRYWTCRSIPYDAGIKAVHRGGVWWLAPSQGRSSR